MSHTRSKEARASPTDNGSPIRVTASDTARVDDRLRIAWLPAEPDA